MKTAGIITTYFATNFGAMLQPFAMKRTLEQLGLDVEIIRYKQPHVYNVYNPLHYRKFIRKNVLAILEHLEGLPSKLKKNQVFQKYLLQHLNPEPGFCKQIPQNKDYYFFGSDQIWNPIVTGGYDKIYFGDFPVKKNAKKIAYAASAESIQYNPNTIEFFKHYLKNFDAIGVREQKLNDDLTKYTGIKNITTVLDPTLIADPAIYNEIEQKNPLPGEKFVLFYKIRNCMYFTDKIYEYAKKTGAKLLILSSWFEKDIVKYAKAHTNIIYMPNAGVETFLGAIKAAECIFTPSFHGCVFPILNHKRFYSLVLKDSWNTRANDLLNTLKLQNRLLTINGTISDNSIDFTEADLILEKRREESLNFIKTSISE
jgi:hypothetical protein